MWSLIDRIIILLIGCGVIEMNYRERTDIAYFLVGIILICFSYLNEKYLKNKYIYIIYLLCMPLCFAFTFTFPYLALITYGVIAEYSEKKGVCIAAISESAVIFCIAFFIRDKLIYTSEYIDIMIIVSFALLVVSVMLAYKTVENTKMNLSIKILRDDAIERTNLLVEKNKYLAENQQNEIHIATLSERNRIAREIHDNVGHMLSRSILQLGAIRTIHKSESIEKELEPLQETLNMAMNNIRESVHDLHKESFDVKDAASKILEDLKDFNVTFDCDFSRAADKEVKYAFLTILKEATTNIEKYSNGDKVKVAMRELEDYYQMLIEDNGNKHVNITHANAGIGISNMKERVQKLKGIITFSGENGFRIFISVPKQK